MAPPRCEIRFDENPQAIYHSGQMIFGAVELVLDKPKLVKDFKLVIAGCAEVEWIDWKTWSRKVNFTAKVDLLRTEIKLIPDTNMEISAGTHVYNFSSPIPSHVPTSFEGKYGKIRYTISAILDRPWKLDQTSTVAFTVLKPLDLNQLMDSIKVHRKEKLTKTFCCWPCASNPLQIEVEIPASGYVPGQTIPVTIVLNNTSSTTVRGIKSSLDQKVSYTSHDPSERTRVVSKSVASVWTAASRETSANYSQNLEIPSVAPTGKCSILTIDYVLKVKVYVEGFHLNPKIKIPITIGTIPFASSPSRTTAVPSGNIGWSDELESAPSAPMLPSVSSDKKDLPPPSYEKAMHGNGTTINVNDE